MSEVQFPGVLGHESAQQMLARAHARQKLHHGLILSGPRGVGKATLARGLAAALLCTEAPGRGCGKCNACRRVLSGRHTDHRTLEGEGKSNMVRVEAARKMVIDAAHAPFEGPAHVIVVDPADRMTPAAAAALLKGIEEPSPGVHWVLLAENFSDVLDTLASRCPHLPLAPLPDATVRSIVDGHIAEHELEPDAAHLDLAVRLAGGSPGVALDLLADSGLDESRELLELAIDATAAGLPGIFDGDKSPLWASWNAAVLASPDPESRTPDPEEAVVVVKGKGKKRKSKKAKADKPTANSARQRAAAHRLAALWLLHLRERMQGGPGLRDDPAPAEVLGRRISAVAEFQRALARNPNVRLSLERLFMEMAA